MTPRPTEIKAIAALLAEGADSPEDLAKTVIRELDVLRTDRVTYTVVCEWVGPVLIGYGPYPTANAARKAVEQGKVPAARHGRNGIVPVYAPRHAEQSIEQSGETP